MKKTPPGKDLHGTVGEAAYNMNLSVQRWLRYRDRKSYRDVMQNKDVVQHLLSVSTPVPQVRAFRSWREQLFKDGIPALGLKTGLRLLATLLGITLACVMAYWIISPRQPSTPGSGSGSSNTSNTTPNTTATVNPPNTNNTNDADLISGIINTTNTGSSNGTTRNLGNRNARGGNSNTTKDNSRPVSPPLNARLFDQFPNVKDGDASARLDNFAIQLQQDPAARGMIFYSEGGGYSKEEARKRALSFKTYLVNLRAIDYSRILVKYGGSNSQETFSLYIVPTDNQNTPANQPSMNSTNTNQNRGNTNAASTSTGTPTRNGKKRRRSTQPRNANTPTANSNK
jgi:hypothetical protein